MCIEACPVDAIVGAAKFMHTVIGNACTGCELCIPPCPVDCIEMHAAAAPKPRHAAAEDARRRFLGRNARRKSTRARKSHAVAAQRAADADRKKRETVAKAIERARVRLAERDR